MKVKTVNVFLTERDHQILISLFKNKVMSFKQVHETFFKGATKPIISRRMHKLIDKRLIKPKGFFVNRKRYICYEISAEGVKVIQHRLNHQVNLKNYKSDSIEHDMDLFDITKHIKDFNAIKQVFTESELQSCSKYLDNKDLRSFVHLRSDRVLGVSVNSKIRYFAFEFERFLKSSDRNIAKFKDYYDHRDIPVALYVCQSDGMAKSLMKIDKEVREDYKPKFYFINVEKFKSKSKELTFHNSDGEVLNLIKSND